MRAKRPVVGEVEDGGVRFALVSLKFTRPPPRLLMSQPPAANRLSPPGPVPVNPSVMNAFGSLRD
jgi:hypothetical protein